MNCDRCPHMKRIKAALSPCQACEAGRLHGQIAITNETVDWALAKRKKSDRTTVSGVTTLNAETEDALRIILAQFAQLEPIEILLIHHALNGGGYADFRDPLARLNRRLRTKTEELDGKSDGFRSLAHSWGQKIKARLPVFSSILPNDDND